MLQTLKLHSVGYLCWFCTINIVIQKQEDNFKEQTRQVVLEGEGSWEPKVAESQTELWSQWQSLSSTGPKQAIQGRSSSDHQAVPAIQTVRDVCSDGASLRQDQHQEGMTLGTDIFIAQLNQRPKARASSWVKKQQVSSRPQSCAKLKTAQVPRRGTVFWTWQPMTFCRWRLSWSPKGWVPIFVINLQHNSQASLFTCVSPLSLAVKSQPVSHGDRLHTRQPDQITLAAGALPQAKSIPFPSFLDNGCKSGIRKRFTFKSATQIKKM